MLYLVNKQVTIITDTAVRFREKLKVKKKQLSKLRFLDQHYFALTLQEETIPKPKK